MKKLLLLAAIFALIFAACPTDDGRGKGGGNENGGSVVATTLMIKNESYKAISNVVWQNILFYGENADVIGTWKGYSSNPFYLELFLSSTSWTLTANSPPGSMVGYSDSAQGTWTRHENTLTLESSPAGKNGTAILSNETLTLSYRSSTYTLTSDNIDKSIKPGNNVTKAVNPGSGFIFFDVNDTSYCTKDLIVVEENENAEFNFTNNTLIVDVNNTSNTLTLGWL